MEKYFTDIREKELSRWKKIKKILFLIKNNGTEWVEALLNVTLENLNAEKG